MTGIIQTADTENQHPDNRLTTASTWQQQHFSLRFQGLVNRNNSVKTSQEAPPQRMLQSLVSQETIILVLRGYSTELGVDHAHLRQLQKGTSGIPDEHWSTETGAPWWFSLEFWGLHTPCTMHTNRPRSLSLQDTERTLGVDRGQQSEATL